MKPKKVPESFYIREHLAARIKRLKREAAARERKILEATSLGKLIR